MPEKKSVSTTSEIEDKIMIYARAVCGLYERMLRYARCVTDAKVYDYTEMRALANTVYATDELGFDLKRRLKDGSKREKILTDLEKDYKNTCLIYKDLFAASLNTCFENELEADFEGNTFPDPADRSAFEALRRQAGQRVFGQIAACALEGDPHFQLLLGKSYFLGWGTRVNTEEGLRWIERAADTGENQALLYAGLAEETVHHRQTGYRFNPESADRYEAAYESGNSTAAYALYRFNKYHLSDYSSVRAAKKWLRRGKEDENVYCNYTIQKPPKTAWAPGNVKNALDWVRAAAAFKEPEAFLLLANLYGKGHAGLEKDDAREEECLYTAIQLS